MTDLEEMRKRYAYRPDVCSNCGTAYRGPETLDCHGCGAIHIPDPSVLALCDEVEVLRAQVASAPEVLMEWPAKAEDAPGEWFFCLHGTQAPRGAFEDVDNTTVFRDDEGSAWPPHEFEPGEFFVRVP